MRTLVACAVLVLVAACGSSSSSPEEPAKTPVRLSPPEQAVSSLMRALEDGDCRAARRLVVTPSTLGCDEVEQSAGSFEAEGIDLAGARYRAGAVHDDSAVVSIRWDAEHPRESYDVQRIDGRWKVVFDSAA